MFLSQAIGLTDLSSVGEARRAGQRMADTMKLDEVSAGELGILITEAARNAVVHGRGGTLVLSGFATLTRTHVDVLALDKGPGIADMNKAMSDGYSTGSTPGTGLGAIRRISQTLDVFSTAQGTAVLARLVNITRAEEKHARLDIAGLTAALAGESVCGDGFAWHQAGDRTSLALVDGLGHGREANLAANEALAIFNKYSGNSVGDILMRMHDALRKTRGAAAAIAQIRPSAGKLAFAGVGNISAVMLSDSASRNLVSHNGTLGHIANRFQEFTVDWHPDSLLIMHSDGLQTRWDLSKYPGLIMRDPALIAGVLLRDSSRQRDDASVAVVRNHRAVAE